MTWRRIRNNLAAERGPSLFDARHRLVFSYQWSLPFFEHKQGVVSSRCWADGNSMESLPQ